MCGLSGFLWVPDRCGLVDTARQMANAIIHRGPDDVGVWVDEVAGFALAHRRLAIIDLSAAGHQPMHSTSGRWVIAFNGEVYNHVSLRTELQKQGAAPIWRGHSDTETLLAGFEHWGIESTLQRCVGMFAIALWDRETRTLTLARDRFGEKPLYYGWVGRGEHRAFVFGSELKAMKAYPGFDATVCRQALSQYLRFMYVPAPRSIYQGIYKLEPGCLLTITGTVPLQVSTQPLRPGESFGSMRMHRWWSLASTVETGARHSETDEVEALRQLETQLTEAVRLQSLADVPLGAFLSGGVDSSAIVALMQHQSSRPIKTFTIGFEEASFDESQHALAVARHLGTEHHEMRVTAQMAQDVIPRLPHMYDEPFADSSQIPTYLVCRAAHQHVTVALSGDAGDEIFGGYNRYLWGPRLWRSLENLPYPMRQALSRLLSSLPAQGWDVLSRPLGLVRPGEKLHKLARALNHTQNLDDFYLNLASEWQAPYRLVLGASSEPVTTTEPASQLDDVLLTLGADAAPLRMMFLDATTYLPDDILCKVDRAAMATSLETRVPFLDHRVVELAWRLPLNMKIRGQLGKWALRQVLYKHVPKELIERPKAGFAVPIGQWLRGPLKQWADALLAADRLKREGYLYPERISRVWKEHLSGSCDHTAKLWSVLMFQAWLEHNSLGGLVKPQ